MPNAVEKLQQSLSKIADDFSKLTVRTLTGPVSARWVAADEEFVIEGHDKAVLRALTQTNVDGDTDLLVPTGPNGEVDQALLALHQEAVKQAAEARGALIKALAEGVRALTGR